MALSRPRWSRSSNPSLIAIVGLVAALAFSMFWNIRLYTVNEERSQRLAALEQEAKARDLAEAEKVQARIKKNAEWAASDARLQQLYREIENLSHANAQIVAKPPRPTAKTTARDAADDTIDQ